MKDSHRGLLSVLGAFIIQLTIGSYHCTFGNLLPYFTSYMRQQIPALNHGDMAQVFSTGGVAQGLAAALGGLVIVPLLGTRGCLVVASILYSIAPLITYFLMDTSVFWISLSYGVLGASSVNLAIIPTLLIPVSWFPNHKGKVLGIISAGLGLSPTIFIPIQLNLINPDNLPPTTEHRLGNLTSATYFKDQEVLNRFPLALLYLSSVYATMLMVGAVLLGQERKGTKKYDDQVGLGERLRLARDYLVQHTFTRLDFYLLFISRFLFQIVGSCISAHWKTFLFTKTDDDKLISIIGGLLGLANLLSRLLSGLLLDKIRFSRLMPFLGLFLTIVLAAIFFVAKISLVGLIICNFAIFLFCFGHFSTIPATLLNLFPGGQNSVVLGSVGLADTMSYMSLGLLNFLVISRDEDPNMFLWLFLILSACSSLSVVATFFVTNEKTENISKQSQETLNHGLGGKEIKIITK